MLQIGKVDMMVKIDRKTFVAAFFLMLLAGFTFADLWGVLIPDIFGKDVTGKEFWGGTLTQCAYTAPDNTWFAISMVALLIAAGLIGFSHVLSGALGARVHAWSKAGMSNLFVSAIIVVALFMGSNLMYDRGISQIDIAQRNVIMIRDTMITEFTLMTSATAVLSLIGNITPYLRPAGIIGISFSLQPAFRPIFDGLGITLSMMTIAIGEWFAHEFMLCFAKTRMLAFIMPIGIFLRTLGGGIERGGNVLIAIAIGLFFIYPFMINVTTYSIAVFFDNQFEDEFGNIALPQQTADGSYRPSCWAIDTVTGDQYQPCFFTLIVKSAVKDLGRTIIENPEGSTLSGIIIFAIIQFFTGSIIATTLLEALIFFLYAVFKASVFYIVIVSILMPLFNIFITLTAIKDMAAALGTDIDLSALEKII